MKREIRMESLHANCMRMTTKVTPSKLWRFFVFPTTSEEEKKPWQQNHAVQQNLTTMQMRHCLDQVGMNSWTEEIDPGENPLRTVCRTTNKVEGAEGDEKTESKQLEKRYGLKTRS